MSEAVQAEWGRSSQCLKTAGGLLLSGDFDGCASRAYYAVFHAVTALFMLEGRGFAKHSGLEAAVHRDLVQTGRVNAEFGACYSDLHRMRTIGDYGVSVHVTQADAEWAVRQADDLVRQVRELAGGQLS